MPHRGCEQAGAVAAQRMRFVSLPPLRGPFKDDRARLVGGVLNKQQQQQQKQQQQQQQQQQRQQQQQQQQQHQQQQQQQSHS